MLTPSAVPAARADERAHELAVHFRRHGIHVNSLLVQEGARVLDFVHPRRLNVDLFESRFRQLRRILRILQRAGDAAHPELHALANLPPAPRRAPPRRTRRSRPPGFSTRNASRSTRSLSPERLITQLEMITSTELSGSGMCSISPFRNSTFVHAGLALILPRQRQHLVGHVEAVGFARRAQPGAPTAARRCRRRSPGRARSRPHCNSASAVGLPQPSDASTASAGICCLCLAS